MIKTKNSKREIDNSPWMKYASPDGYKIKSDIVLYDFFGRKIPSLLEIIKNPRISLYDARGRKIEKEVKI